MAKLFHILPFLLFTHFLSAQDEESKDHKKLCNEDIQKKALALYEKGIDKKKYKKPERLDFLKKAVEIEPDFAEAYLAVGLEFAFTCKLDNKPFTPTLPFFYKAIAACPQIHSEPYYYIGFDYYERQMNDSAIKYLQKFIAFKDDDEKKFAKDWDGEMYQAKMMVRSAKKEMGLKKNVQFDPKVITGVSTDRDEYLAYISPDDKSCYFVRRLPIKNMNQVFESDKEKEVFMVAQRDKTGLFNSGEPMSAPFNTTDDNQGGCSISIDNKCLYFAMMREEGGMQPNCDLYVSDNSSGEWGEIRKLSANVNHPKYWDSQPSIASDGLTLYFASDRPGGYGGIDLYCTQKDPVTGQWSVPKNLGPNINTKGDEKTPFIHSDSETLYFSSTGQFGFGGYDIFYVRKNEKGEWGEPENIGSPINGATDDTGFFVSTDAKTGYFFSYDEPKVRGKGIGRYDLFGFDLYKEARPQQVSFAKGNIKDSSGNKISGAVLEVKDIKTKQTSYATVDSASGEYMIAVKKKNDLVLTVKKEDIVFNAKILYIKDVLPMEAEPVVVNLDVKEAKEGSSFVIDNILYNTNSAEIKPESRIILESFAQYLKENPKIKIEIEGHTDNVGNPKDNEALSTNRAFSVKAMLEEFGVDGKRILAKGFGQNKPLADNKTEEGRAKNRRTEFLILEK
jgi:outer membrane protein OmpA-like peptidoglycan-associated protein/tetratricopeptide (TPR) repeat protein